MALAILDRYPAPAPGDDVEEDQPLGPGVERGRQRLRGGLEREGLRELGNGTLFGLHQHGRRPPDEAFSEFRVGLDHVAFGCADREELEKWVLRLDELDIEHGDIKDASYGSGLSFRDPDGIPLEFFAPPR